MKGWAAYEAWREAFKRLHVHNIPLPREVILERDDFRDLQMNEGQRLEFDPLAKIVLEFDGGPITFRGYIEPTEVRTMDNVDAYECGGCRGQVSGKELAAKRRDGETPREAVLRIFRERGR